MVEFSLQRIDWLKTKIKLPNGIPSHDTFNRVALLHILRKLYLNLFIYYKIPKFVFKK